MIMKTTIPLAIFLMRVRFCVKNKFLHGNIETYGVPSAQECVRGTLDPDREESHRMLLIVKFQKNEFLDDPCLQKLRRIKVTRDGEATKHTRQN